MRVDLGRCEALVAEKLLDHAQVGPTVEEMGREAVAERVWRDTHRQAREAAEPVEAVPQAANHERITEVVEEDLRRVGRVHDTGSGPGRQPAGSSPEKDRSPIRQVGREGQPCRPAEEADPLLATLAQDAQLTAPEIEGIGGCTGELADAKSRRIRRLDESSIS